MDQDPYPKFRTVWETKTVYIPLFGVRRWSNRVCILYANTICYSPSSKWRLAFPSPSMRWRWDPSLLRMLWWHPCLFQECGVGCASHLSNLILYPFYDILYAFYYNIQQPYGQPRHRAWSGTRNQTLVAVTATRNQKLYRGQKLKPETRSHKPEAGSNKQETRKHKQ